jgi:hypothetical protein
MSMATITIPLMAAFMLQWREIASFYLALALRMMDS